MNKAIFLDRDGVINKSESYYTFKKENFVFNDGVIEALAQLQKKKYLLFIITNQSGVAKKFYSNADVEKVHDFMNEKFLEKGITIAETYYCPHHPEVSKCICRKPDSLLIEKLIARFQISPALSYFIGDRERDIQAAHKANVKGILIEENSSMLNILNQIA